MKVNNLRNKDKEYEKYDKYQHVYCSKCGHSFHFLSNYPATCSYCGTLVYPSKKSEFRDKLKFELRKVRREENECSNT